MSVDIINDIVNRIVSIIINETMPILSLTWNDMREPNDVYTVIGFHLKENAIKCVRKQAVKKNCFFEPNYKYVQFTIYIRSPVTDNGK